MLYLSNCNSCDFFTFWEGIFYVHCNHLRFFKSQLKGILTSLFPISIMGLILTLSPVQARDALKGQQLTVKLNVLSV